MREPDVLHTDDPAAEVEVGGRTVRNLSADEYAATWADGEPHTIPVGVLAAAEADATRIAAGREG